MFADLNLLTSEGTFIALGAWSRTGNFYAERETIFNEYYGIFIVVISILQGIAHKPKFMDLKNTMFT